MTFHRADRGSLTRLVLFGELDAYDGRELVACADELIEDQQQVIAIDMSGLDYIDSTGVAILVSLFKRARTYGGVVVIDGARDQPLAILRLLQLDRVFMRSAPVTEAAVTA